MNIRIFRELLSMGLAAALFLSSVLPVSAAAFPEETVPETEAVETVALEVTEQVTLPMETESVTRPTEAVETEPVTLPTEAAETEPATQPTEILETEPVTQPTEATTPLQVTMPIQPTQPEPEPLTIEEVRALPVGADIVTLQGTVVYLSGSCGVLQDDTGGIRVSFPVEPEVMPGDVLKAAGRRSGGFQILEFNIVDTTAQLPARDYALLDAPEDLRVRIQNAVLGNKTLTQNGFSMSLHGVPTELDQGTRVDAWGVILDGWFYADTLVERSAAKPRAAMAETQPQNLYFGLLHAHTDISGGLGSVWEAFKYASKVEGLDFFAVTDNSISFIDAEKGSLFTNGYELSPDWKAGKDAAASVTNENFVGIFGYETTLTDRGRMNTFNTLGWQTWKKEDFKSQEDYYRVLAQDRNSISQFNHPGQFYGDFDSFLGRTPLYDAVIHLLEVGGEGTIRAYEYYTEALDAGWHVAPTISQNNHNGSWGDASDVRTVVLAEKLDEDALYEAMRNYRVYATEDKDLSIRYTANGADMGTIFGPVEKLMIRAELEDPTDEAIGMVEVIVDEGVVAGFQPLDTSSGVVEMELEGKYEYYYLRITQPDGDIAVTAPVWVDQFEDIRFEPLSASKENPTAGDPIALSVAVFNDETEDLIVESVEFFADGVPISEIAYPAVVEALGSGVCTATYRHTAPGPVTFSVKITGTIAGQSRSFEDETTVMYRSTSTVVTAKIGEIRKGLPGTTYRTNGRITAGNENPYNSFPGYLYLQDETGGIAVKGVVRETLELGKYLEVVGVLLEQEGNLILLMTEYGLNPDIDSNSPLPTAVPCVQTLDYETYGGQLLEVRGTVTSLASEGKEVSRFTLRDAQGGQATVLIEDEIRSGTYGTNELTSKVKKNRTIVAVGLLHVDEYGKSVVRVRDCDEIRYSPPVPDRSNPRTGDWLAALTEWFRSLWEE